MAGFGRETFSTVMSTHSHIDHILDEGRALAGSGRFENAARLYHEAAQSFPQNAALRFQLAYCLDELERKEEALIEWQECVRA